MMIARLHDGGHATGEEYSANGNRRKRSAYPVKEAAIYGLAKISPVGDTRVRDALLACIQDHNQYVREAIIEALQQITSNGDMIVIAALSARLQDHCYRVRRAALTAIPMFSRHGDVGVFRTLLSCFASNFAEVRQDALHAISKLTVVDDEWMIAVIECSQHQHSWVRRLAGHALALTASRGNQQAISALIARLRDSNGHVRKILIES